MTGKNKSLVVSNQKKHISNTVKSIMDDKKQVKWVYVVYPYNSISTGFASYDHTQIAQGVAFNQRVGSSLVLKNMRFRGQLVVGDTTNIVRMLVYRWHPDTNSDIPQASEIFTASSDPLSSLIHYKQRRFKVLADKLFTLDTYNPTQIFDFELKLKSVVNFTGATSGAEHVYVLFLSDSGAAPHPSVTMGVDVNWYDNN